jgi:membrane protein implicated in regulation of membrane protease activity
MDSPEQWRWIWLAATAVFAIGEMATPGSFFLAPFAAGALVASLLAFAGVSVLVEWIVFIVVSVAMLALLRPLSRRLDRDALDHGVGSRRLIGRQATVLRTIPAGDEIGMVRVDREQWRAQSIDGTPIAEGRAVRIADVQGTRVIVAPVDGTPSSAEMAPEPTVDEAVADAIPTEPAVAPNPPTPTAPPAAPGDPSPTAGTSPASTSGPAATGPAGPAASVQQVDAPEPTRPAPSQPAPATPPEPAASAPAEGAAPSEPPAPEPSPEPVEPPAGDGPSSP